MVCLTEGRLDPPPTPCHIPRAAAHPGSLAQEPHPLPRRDGVVWLTQ